MKRIKQTRLPVQPEMIRGLDDLRAVRGGAIVITDTDGDGKGPK